MATSRPSKKRKIDCEGRAFKDSWTLDYVFRDSSQLGKPQCLLCSQTVAVYKECNLKRHHDTKHSQFVNNFPLNSERRRLRVDALITQSAFGISSMVKKTITNSTRATEASYKVAHILAKHGKPFTDSEIVKECMVAMCDSMLDGKQQQEIKTAVEQVPLSRQTTTRRIEDISKDVSQQLINDLREVPVFSIALDESTDIADVAQLCVFVRFLKSDKFVEELLCMLPLEGQTRGEDVYTAVTGYLKLKGIPTEKIISVTTDGAPSMVGRHNGFATLMKNDNPNVLSYHCIIHQSVLCAKLNVEFQSLLLDVMKLVNFLRSSSALTHRNFRKFLDEVNATYNDLLLYNNVRWLSKGQTLTRVWELRSEIAEFLNTLKSPKATILVIDRR